MVYGVKMVSKYFSSPRNDVIDLVNMILIKEKGLILDVGCGTGRLGKKVSNNKKCIVHGVEIDRESSEMARNDIDLVINGDIESKEVVGRLSDNYGLIICADVIEHLTNPLITLGLLTELLAKRGYLVISLPNFAYYKTFYYLLIEQFPRNNRGIYDKTHRWLFARKNIDDILGLGYEVIIHKRNYRFVEGGKTNVDSVLKYIPFFSNYFVFQHLYVLRRTY